ncbi:MAG: OpgC domain-containing protein [Pseudomonadota bacterium]
MSALPETSGAAKATRAGGKKPRDMRLDFFRGMAMFIILFAHISGNLWTLWIPARFGFSDATEIFVFCSGFASSLAFGVVFLQRGFLLGLGRIAFRIWQVYWCHIGIILVAATISFTIQHYGLGEEGRNYLARPYLVPIFNETGEAILGLLTLTYVPGLFDILPMYLVILALVPVVMAAYRFGGRLGVAALVIGLWVLATLAGLARQVEPDWTGPAAALAPLGEGLLFLNLPSFPWSDGTWFFNPFAWQLVFFTGFAFGMRWIPAPPVSPWLVRLAIAVVLLSMPFAWHKFYAYLTGWLPEGWLSVFFWDAREATRPLWTKTWFGLFRFLHFLSIAYLAWAAVGPGGERLTRAIRLRVLPSLAWRRIGIGAAILGVLTFPYGWVEEIHAYLPGLERALLVVVPIVEARWMGLPQILHLLALLTGLWAALGPRGRAWVLGPAWLSVVPVIRKVGTQSLAVFVFSIPLAVTLGWILDLTGETMLPVAAANIGGSALLIGVAYTAAWFRRQPWRGPSPTAAPRTAPETGGSGVTMRDTALAVAGPRPHATSAPTRQSL